MSDETTRQALLASHQCIVDFLELISRQASIVAVNEAVKDLAYDALPKVRAALDELEIEHKTPRFTKRALEITSYTQAQFFAIAAGREDLSHE